MMKLEQIKIYPHECNITTTFREKKELQEMQGDIGTH